MKVGSPPSPFIPPNPTIYHLSLPMPPEIPTCQNSQDLKAIFLRGWKCYMQDFVSEQSANLLKRINDLEKMLSNQYPSIPVRAPLTPLPPFTVDTLLTFSSPSPLQDICNSNRLEEEFTIPMELILTALNGCRSR